MSGFFVTILARRRVAAIVLGVLAACAHAPAQPDAAELGSGDPQRGAEVFRQACQPCHDAKPGAHQVGPSLCGVLGREVGAADGYRRYSPALKQAGGSWTRERLERYLRDPQAMFPEQRKRYSGLAGAQDRVDLIAYLRHLGP